MGYKTIPSVLNSDANSFSIYIGKAPKSDGQNSGNKPPYDPWAGISRAHRQLLLMAYAYTYTSLSDAVSRLESVDNAQQEAIDQLLADFTTLSEQVNENTAKLDAVDILNDTEFRDKLNEIYENLDSFDVSAPIAEALAQSYAYTNSRVNELQQAILDAFGVETVDELPDMGDFVTHDQLDEYGYITHSQLDEYGYVTQSALTGFATKQELAELAEGGVNIDLSAYAKLTDLPQSLSQLTNDAGYVTNADVTETVNSRINDLVDGAPAAYDTFKEVAEALVEGQSVLDNLTERIINQTWEQQPGVPILTTEMVEYYQDTLPRQYIEFGTSYELFKPAEPIIDLQAENSQFYLGVIFSTLRSLQREVAKIRNTFKYGMYSYTNTDTAMSSVMNDLTDVQENEPLWAVDPDSLSAITGAEFYTDTTHTLQPTNDDCEIVVGNGALAISGTAQWLDEYSPYGSNYGNCLRDCTDAKEFVFMTTDNLNIKVTLANYESAYRSVDVDLSEISIPATLTSRYNVLVCVSRALLNEKTEQYDGKNFVWISIGDYASGRNLVEGYWRDGVLYENETLIGLNGNEFKSLYRHYISSIDFTDVTLYKMAFYSKYQDLSNDVMPSVPTDSDYKYSVAHLTIRSVKNYEMMESIKDQLPENELIYNDENNCIYIKKDNTIKIIFGGGGTPTPPPTEEGMTQQEIMDWLAENGLIINQNGEGEDATFESLSLNPISDITFINEATRKTYKFSVDSEGNLRGVAVNKGTTLGERLIAAKFPVAEIYADTMNKTFNAASNGTMRGLVGTLGEYEGGYREIWQPATKITDNIGLFSDRIKITSIYAPLSTQKTFGCTHAFVELENSSQTDFQLDDVYLHYVRKINGQYVYNVVELEGVIPAGGTYLIRGKKYSDIKQANTFIDVATFDKEWYDSNGELLDFTLGTHNTFALVYKLKDIDIETVLAPSITASSTEVLRYHPFFIDSVSIIGHVTTATGASTWNNGNEVYKNPTNADCIYRTTFELDPAQQAYQGLAATSDKTKKIYDSSRLRNNTATDLQTLTLEKLYIEFPKKDAKCDIRKFTPKASWEKKNVCTDKTDIDMEKPNMVTVSFGINMFTTRCFNWISAGEFNEYVWLRRQGETEWSNKFESYTKIGSGSKVVPEPPKDKNGNIIYPYRKDFSPYTNDIVYARIQSDFPATDIHYTSHKCVVELAATNPANVGENPTPVVYEYVVGRADKNGNVDAEHCSDVMTFTVYPNSYVPKIYQITDQQGFHWIEYQAWAAAAEKLNSIIAQDCQNSNIIPILVNTGDMTQNGTRINEWYDYYMAGTSLFNHLEQMNVVGNNDLCGQNVTALGTGDDTGKSNPYYFHVFYCYEVDEESTTTENEGVTTYEYKYLPIVNDKYIPSMYWFTNGTYVFFMMNSELTYVHCRDWFGTKETITVGNKNIELATNIYTGYRLSSSSDYAPTQEEAYNGSFTSVYTMVYNLMKKYITDGGIAGSNFLVACHEMPFTVITRDNLKSNTLNSDRSLNSSNSNLVGSHLNRMNSNDKYGIYWFSRLLENFGIKLCYGGHKHTYMCSNRLRELYTFKKVENGELVTKSSIDEKMIMPQTLETDTASFKLTGYRLNTNGKSNYNIVFDNSVDYEQEIADSYAYNSTFNEEDGTYTYTYYYNLSWEMEEGSTTERKPFAFNSSKFPIMSTTSVLNGDGKGMYTYIDEGIIAVNNNVFPYYGYNYDDASNDNGVIYLMCQATGFKLKSNKELPSPDQKFSYIIPSTGVNSKTGADSPDANQQYPMYMEICPDTHTVYLGRFDKILVSKTFTQSQYGTAATTMQYARKPSKAEIDAAVASAYVKITEEGLNPAYLPDFEKYAYTTFDTDCNSYSDNLDKMIFGRWENEKNALIQY